MLVTVDIATIFRDRWYWFLGSADFWSDRV